MSAATADISYQEEDKPLHMWLGLGEVNMIGLANESPNKGKTMQKCIILEQKPCDS